MSNLPEAIVPQSAVDLILESEGVDQPSKWPGGDSGITIGFGYDLGFETTFGIDWANSLTSQQIARLSQSLGKAGEAAEALAAQYWDIHIDRAIALDVFLKATLPRTVVTTLRAFPGSAKLPAETFGALVSLVFNRGPGMQGDRRVEMRAIRDGIASARTMPEKIQLVVDNLREMKHLWEAKGLDGLLKRRDAEADLALRGLDALTSRVA